MTDSSQRIRFGLEWLGDLELARPRCRWQIAPGRWEVQVHIERFVEPTLLLLLSERPRHGYELGHEIARLAGDHTSVDIGNLYRVLRGLEFEGLITSQWIPQPTGPPRRTYDLSPAGARVLATWAGAMEETQATLATFLTRYHAARRTTGPRS